MSIFKHTLVKFCGIVTQDDLETAVNLQVDAVGFVFYPRSPRYLEIRDAIFLRKIVPPSVQVVGLFVNEAPEKVRLVCEQVGLDIIQFHGEETRELCNQSSPPGIPYWKALHIGEQCDFLKHVDFTETLHPVSAHEGSSYTDTARDPVENLRPCSGLVLDSKSSDYGGSGLPFNLDWIPPNWRTISSKPPLVLAGGLDANSVEEAILRIRPRWVDVSSGIQVSVPSVNKRKKSKEKMESFLSTVRSLNKKLFEEAAYL